MLRMLLRMMLIKFKPLSCSPTSSSKVRRGETKVKAISRLPQCDNSDLLFLCTLPSTLVAAFGNAKTLRNDNSSRFGKYIKLRYDGSYTLRGAYTEHFLLEKTRLLQADKGERNYHVFYQLLAGLDDATKESLHLSDPADFSMLSCGETLAVDGIDDRSEFELLAASLSTIGFTEQVRKRA
jgi:myosin-5